MTQIDEPNLDEQIDKLLRDFDNTASIYTIEVKARYETAKAQVRELISDQVAKARIDEMERFANAKINHQSEPALFNPDGLPISTPITEEMTRLVNQAAKDRIAQLRSTPNEDMDN